MKSGLFLVCATAAVMAVCAEAGAQQTPSWSDINCSLSKIAAPAGLRCRATQEVAGGFGVRSGPGGTFRSWTAFGTTSQGKLYYYLIEGTTGQSNIYTTEKVEGGIRILSPQGKNARNFGETTPINGGDFVRFISEAGENCVGIRKVGPVTGAGYRWMLHASRCAPIGKQISGDEIAKFIEGTGYRE